MTERRSTYKTDPLRDMQPGLKKSILRALERAKGIDNAISQERLLSACKLALGQENLTNRQVRNAVNELRNEGYLICSLSGRAKSRSANRLYAELGLKGPDAEGSGYYIPVTLEEYRRYRSFYMSYAKNIFDTLRILDKSAAQEFPIDLGYQPGLFQDLPKESELM